MFKRVAISLTIALFSTAGVFAQVIDKPAATVSLTKPEYISVNQLNQRVDQIDNIRKQNGLPIPADNKTQVLDSMISEILISQAAARANITITQSEVDDTIAKQKQAVEAQVGQLDDTQFHTVIEQQTGLTWKDYVQQLKTQLTEQKYIMKEKGNVLNNVPTPTDQQIQERYGQIASRLTNPEIVRFSQIFIDTRNLTSDQKQKAKERADKIYREYLNGTATFDQLVQQYTDDQHARYNGGDFGYLARDDARAQQVLGQKFVNELFALKKGDVKGVLESRIGYHIVKITEHYAPKLLTLNDPISPANKTTVRQYITQSLEQQEKSQAFNKAVQDVIASLKKEADIHIYQDNLK